MAPVSTLARGEQRVALLYPGDRTARDRADPAESRFAALFDAFAAAGIAAEPAVYHDDFAGEVQAQLLGCAVVLVWHNPIEGGRRRTRLDAMLQTVADAGVQVSSHPDTILKLGTKDVLLATRHLPFGSDVERIDSLAQLQAELPARLVAGPRVLKQHRGHSGMGVWRVERAASGVIARAASAAGEAADDRPAVRLREARRGSEETVVDWDTLCATLAPCFEAEVGGHLIDQAWQPRLAEGMLRAYLVEDRVGGFGHQAINALYPTAPGEPAIQPGPRLYHPSDAATFQPLKRLLEGGWIEQLRHAVGVAPERLPLLWDCDFLLGPPNAQGNDSYVLCEINVSSVSPFPPSCIALLVAAMRQKLGTGQAHQGS